MGYRTSVRRKNAAIRTAAGTTKLNFMKPK
jgi:hypothetical protein